MRAHFGPLAAVALTLSVPALAQTAAPAGGTPTGPADVGSPAAAAPDNSSPAVIAAVEGARKHALESRVASDSNARTGLPLSSFSLRAGTDDTDVSLTLSTAHDLLRAYGEFNAALTLSAPVDKKTKRGFLLTQDGLPGSVRAGLSLSGTRGNYKPPSNLRRLRELQDAAGVSCRSQKKPGDSDEALQRRCTWSNGFRPDGFSYLSPDQKNEYDTIEGTNAAGFINQSLLFWNVTGEVGVTDFTFDDPTSFQSSKQRKTGYSLSGSIGYSDSPTAIFFLGSAEYRQSWEAPDERIRCPASTTMPVDCVKAVFGPPTKNIDYKFSLLARAADIFGPRLPVAIELKGSYDAKDNEFGVEMPVYLFLDDQKKLRGGVRVGWDSNHDEVRLGVFIGAPFGLFDH